MSVTNGLAQIKTHTGATKEFTDYADLDGTGESDIFSEEEIRLLLSDVMGLPEGNPEIDIVINALKEDQGITGNAPLTMDGATLSDFLDIDDDNIIEESDIATTGEEGAIKHIIAKGDGVDNDDNDIEGTTKLSALGKAERRVVLETLQGMVNDSVTNDQVRAFYNHASSEGWALEGLFNLLDGKVDGAKVATTYEYTAGDWTTEGVVGDDDISGAEASFAILEILGENDGAITRTQKEGSEINESAKFGINHFEAATDAEGRLHKSGLQDILVNDYNVPPTIAEKITDNIFAEVADDWNRMSPEKLLGIVDFDNSGSLSGSEFVHFIDQKNTEETLNVNNVDQGNYGNCWFLSGMMAIGNTEEGQQAIDRSITQKENGDYIVTFPADPDRSYTVTQDELNGDEYKHLSKGQKLMKVFEIAAEKFDDANEDFFEGDGLDTGSPQRVGRLFNIETEGVYDSSLSSHEGTLTDKLIKYAKDNPDNIALSFSAQSNYPALKPATGEADPSSINHQWTITDIDIENEKVYFVNPWDSSDTLEADFEEFEGYSIRTLTSFDT